MIVLDEKVTNRRSCGIAGDKTEKNSGVGYCFEDKIGSGVLPQVGEKRKLGKKKGVSKKTKRVLGRFPHEEGRDNKGGGKNKGKLLPCPGQNPKEKVRGGENELKVLGAPFSLKGEIPKTGPTNWGSMKRNEVLWGADARREGEKENKGKEWIWGVRQKTYDGARVKGKKEGESAIARAKYIGSTMPCAWDVRRGK